MDTQVVYISNLMRAVINHVMTSDSLTASRTYLSVDTLAIFTCSLILLAVVRRLASRRSNEYRQRPPCLPSLPILGSLPLMFEMKRLRNHDFLLMREIAELCMKKSDTMGNIIAFYSMAAYTVVLSGKSTIHEAFVKKAVHFADRKQLFLEKYCTNPKLKGLSFSPYSDEFNKTRNTVLSFLRDLGFGKRISEVHIHQQLELLLESIEKSNGRPLNPTSRLQLCITGTILAFVFGRQFHAGDPLLKELATFVEIGNKLFWQLEVTPILRFWPSHRKNLQRLPAITANLYELTDREISRCLSTGDENNLVSKYAQKRGTTQEAREDLHFIVRDLFTAGSDTLVATLRWLLVMLANYPHIQEQLHREIDNFYGETLRLPIYEDQPHLPLVEATILETLRVEPLLPLVSRQTFCDTEVEGFFIPKGSHVYANFYSVNMNPDHWENVSEFDPKRFIGVDGKIFGKDRVIPFSLGKRACPGEPLARPQLFIGLTGLLQRFQICPPEGRDRVEVQHLPSFLIEPSAFEVRFITHRPNGQVRGN